MQGVQAIERLQVLIQIIIVCRLWASKRGGTTFTVDVNALSVIEKAENLTLDAPGGPLSEVQDWFCAKKWSESRIAGVVR